MSISLLVTVVLIVLYFYMATQAVFGMIDQAQSSGHTDRWPTRLTLFILMGLVWPLAIIALGLIAWAEGISERRTNNHNNQERENQS